MEVGSWSYSSTCGMCMCVWCARFRFRSLRKLYNWRKKKKWTEEGKSKVGLRDVLDHKRHTLLNNLSPVSRGVCVCVWVWGFLCVTLWFIFCDHPPNVKIVGGEHPLFKVVPSLHTYTHTHTQADDGNNPPVRYTSTPSRKHYWGN